MDCERGCVRVRVSERMHKGTKPMFWQLHCLAEPEGVLEGV